jgi:hypothetical protein
MRYSRSAASATLAGWNTGRLRFVRWLYELLRPARPTAVDSPDSHQASGWALKADRKLPETVAAYVDDAEIAAPAILDDAPSDPVSCGTAKPDRQKELSPDLRHIHLDRPGDLSAVSHGEVFEGWTISPNPSDRISITINRRPIKVHEFARPDVERKYPGLNSKGREKPGIALFRTRRGAAGLQRCSRSSRAASCLSRHGGCLPGLPQGSP